MASEEVKGLGWGLAAKACDSCKAASALLFCRADSAFLCISCDAKIHGANKLASRHERVWICEVCEQAPAAVTCKADAAALCVTCDRDIHSANPLARRHDRLPVVPFFDSPAVKLGNINHSLLVPDDNAAAASAASQFDADADDDEEEEEEEDAAEAESWLLSSDPPSHAKLINNNEIGNNQNHHHHHHHQHQNMMNIKSNGEVDHYLFSDVVDPYLDLDYGPRFQFPNHHGTADSVVPVVNHPNHHHRHGQQSDLSSDHITPVFINPANSDHNHNSSLDMDFYRSSSKPTSFSYTTAPSLSQSVSSSSLDVGVVPDGINSVSEISNPFARAIKTTTTTTSSTTNPPINPTTNHHMEFGVVAAAAAAANNSNSSTTQQLQQQQQQLCGVDREARVLRYREKRKNRKFEKTIRYASRKAYAETRPRIKGRFAKRTEIEADVDRIYSSDATIIDVAGYGIVPSF